MARADDNSIYCAVPSRSRARVYVPLATGRELKANLQMYEPADIKARLFKAGLLSLPRILQYQYLQRCRVDTGLAARLSRVVEQILGELRPGMEPGAIYQGTRGPREKLTIQLAADDRVVGYVKVAEKREAARLLDREYEILRALNAGTFSSARVPGLGGYQSRVGMTWLCQLVPEGLAHDVQPKAADILDFVEESSRRSRVRGGPDDILAPNLEYHLTEEEKSLLRRLKGVLDGHWGAEGIVTHFGHGDFTPWNVRRVSDGKLYVFDWEYGSDRLPALFDLFHFLIMPELFVKKEQPVVVASRILDPGGAMRPLVAQAAKRCGIHDARLPMYLALYLWSMVRRSVVVDDEAGKRVDTQLTRNSSFRRMLHYVLAEHGEKGRKKVLVSAYACEPGRGSEPGVGWNMIRAIGENNTAWVVTRKSNQDAIEAHIRDHPLDNVHFVYTDLPRWLAFWKKGGRGIRTYYYLWQFAALKVTLQCRGALKWDIAHHVTFVNDWLFTFLGLLPGHFIWGPIGSHPKIPRGLAHDRAQAVKDSLRCGFQGMMRYVDPLYWLSAWRCTLVVGISEEVFERGPLRWVSGRRRQVHTAIGLEDEFYEQGSARERGGTAEAGWLDIVSIGRLIPVKGFHLALEGFAKYIDRGGRGRLEIIGRGSEEKRLRRLADKLGISGHVTFTPWMNRGEVIERLGSADVFLYPSFESGGIVVLEAMGLGVPVIASGVGGPGEFLEEGGGMAISPQERGRFTDAIAEHLLELAESPAARGELGKRGRERVVRKYLWSRRSAVVERWYSETA